MIDCLYNMKISLYTFKLEPIPAEQLKIDRNFELHLEYHRNETTNQDFVYLSIMRTSSLIFSYVFNDMAIDDHYDQIIFPSHVNKDVKRFESILSPMDKTQLSQHMLFRIECVAYDHIPNRQDLDIIMNGTSFLTLHSKTDYHGLNEAA